MSSIFCGLVNVWAGIGQCLVGITVEGALRFVHTVFMKERCFVMYRAIFLLKLGENC